MENKIHLTMQRLFEITKLQPTELAKALGTSPQNVTNWSARGISKSGLIRASEILGVNPNYILKGMGSPTIEESTVGLMQDNPTNETPLIQEEIAMRIIEERAQNGYTQQEFANYLQIDIQQLKNYEFGKQPIPAKILAAIAASGLDIQYILTGQRLNPPDSSRTPQGVNITSSASNIHSGIGVINQNKIEQLEQNKKP